MSYIDLVLLSYLSLLDGSYDLSGGWDRKDGDGRRCERNSDWTNRTKTSLSGKLAFEDLWNRTEGWPSLRDKCYETFGKLSTWWPSHVLDQPRILRRSSPVYIYSGNFTSIVVIHSSFDLTLYCALHWDQYANSDLIIVIYRFITMKKRISYLHVAK